MLTFSLRQNSKFLHQLDNKSMQYKKSILNLILLLIICFISSEINAQKGNLEAHLIFSPLGRAVKGNKFKTSGDNFMTVRNFEQNIYEIGGGIRFYHKKNFGYEFRTALKNYQFSYTFDAPLDVPFPRTLYTSVVDIDLNLLGFEFGLFYRYRKFTTKFDIEFNHPYRIEGIGPKRLPYDKNTPPILTNYGSEGVLPNIIVTETFSIADESYAYIIPKLTMEYSISKRLDLYSSCKFKLHAQTPFHTFDANYRDEENTPESQIIKVYENFLSFHIGMRYNLQLLKRD